MNLKKNTTPVRSCIDKIQTKRQKVEVVSSSSIHSFVPDNHVASIPLPFDAFFQSFVRRNKWGSKVGPKGILLTLNGSLS